MSWIELLTPRHRVPALGAPSDAESENTRPLGGALPRAIGAAIRAQLDSGAFFHHPTSHRKSDDAVTRKAITNDYARYAAYAGQMCD